MPKFTNPDDAPEGHKWQTVEGEAVTHLTAIPHPKGSETLVGFVDGEPCTWFADGVHCLESASSFDLIDAPVEREAWINVYEHGSVNAHDTREEADLCAGKTRISCHKFTIIEGQFDE